MVHDYVENRIPPLQIIKFREKVNYKLHQSYQKSILQYYRYNNFIRIDKLLFLFLPINLGI